MTACMPTHGWGQMMQYAETEFLFFLLFLMASQCLRGLNNCQNQEDRLTLINLLDSKFPNVQSEWIIQVSFTFDLLYICLLQLCLMITARLCRHMTICIEWKFAWKLKVEIEMKDGSSCFRIFRLRQKRSLLTFFCKVFCETVWAKMFLVVSTLTLGII